MTEDGLFATGDRRRAADENANYVDPLRFGALEALESITVDHASEAKTKAKPQRRRRKKKAESEEESS